MCGIFGVMGGDTGQFTPDQIYKIFNTLAVRSEERGREAAGCAILYNNQISVFKQPLRISRMLKSKSFIRFVNDKLGLPIAIIGHSRLVTNGSQSEENNNQPVVTDNVVGVHNGILVNEEEIKSQYDIQQVSGLDTEVLFKLIEQERTKTNKLERVLKASFNKISGSASIAFFSAKDDALALATNTGSLYYALASELNLGLFASEMYILNRVIETSIPKTRRQYFKIERLEAQTGIIVDYSNLAHIKFSLKTDVTDITVNSSPRYNIPVIISQSGKRKELPKCTKCLLPITFPNISFDVNGVCNYCRDYRPPELKGEQELQALVEPYRSKNGNPDCILALSGGRDSSYGLHYVKKVLGMNPISFTYDWGMVTDVARRNIAKVCGSLGVENIVRSPDISVKRRNIRLNIEAWLKSPDLGMIPLFMAGDKQFYHIARKLRKETGINLVFFCAGNPLEKTEFKTGFCGIKETAHGSRLWNYSLKNKVDLIKYYGKNYLINPAYFNRSIWDTLHAYYSTYVAKDDFVYLYQYIPWNEKVISQVLEQNYGWEKAVDTNNTWRIGDGTAAFYNYIYYTMAGFSEYDTFRSNQIRAGLITREEGLKLVEQDNKPRYESLQQYALTIGLNLDYAMTIINRAPKVYSENSY
jgi:Glucosamine 6-phosphate synthetase, contains amidotransferase and phosphosugar isomerase domains